MTYICITLLLCVIQDAETLCVLQESFTTYLMDVNLVLLGISKYIVIVALQYVN